jgi:hypothetical protein
MVSNLPQLSAINVTACKSPVLVLNSLAVEDEVSRLFELLQECTNFAQYKTFKIFMILISIGCTRDVVLEDRNSSWIFFKELK